MLLTVILAIVAVTFSVFWLWLKHHFNYWKRHNVPYIKPNFIFGNFKSVVMSSEDPCTFLEKLYNHDNAKGKPVIGLHIFNKPCLLVRDVELVKAILIKDFNKFSNRHSASDPHSDSLGSDNLFFTKNPKWKEIRVKLTPVFTSGKMKQMFPLIEEIGREFDKYLCELPMDPKTNSIELEVKDINSLYSTDVIALTAYGVHANSLRNPNVKLCGFKVFSKETTVFLRKTLNYVMEERIKSGATRNDLIDILINFRKQAEIANKENDTTHFILEGDCLVAQAAVFFSAGFETSSSAMSFSMYELACHQDIQRRLRDEIRDTLQQNGGKLTYEMINDMKFLNNVVQEVLRFYPPLPFLDRECTLAAGEHGYSLKPYCDFDIPNGMPIYIAASSLHMDPKYFPDPHTFDPDRFAYENKHRVNLNAYLPFGTGPHNCIGERFGLIQTKIGLVSFFRNHYVTPCEKTHKTMKLDKRALIIQSEGGIHLNIIRDPLL